MTGSQVALADTDGQFVSATGLTAFPARLERPGAISPRGVVFSQPDRGGRKAPCLEGDRDERQVEPHDGTERDARRGASSPKARPAQIAGMSSLRALGGAMMTPPGIPNMSSQEVHAFSEERFAKVVADAKIPKQD